MICLNNTDTLEGGASVNAVVDYTVHGLVGTSFTQIAQGQLSNTNPSVLYTAGAAISIVSVIYVNTHSAAVTVDLYLDPANAGTPRRMIPKNLSLGIGYSAHFDGQRLTILDASGRIGTGTLISIHGSTHLLNGTDPIGLPKFSAHKNGTNQTGIVTGTSTKVTFTTEDWDDGGGYDAPNSRWVPGVLGKGHIDVSVYWDSSSDQSAIAIQIYKNGVFYKGTYIIVSGTTNTSISTSKDILVDNIADYFEIYAFQSSGSDKVIRGDAAWTWFSGHMLP